MINLGTLQKLVDFTKADEQLIRQHRKELYQQIDDTNQRFSQWFIDEAGWPDDGPPPLLPGFIKSILAGSYEEDFIAQQYQQALYWYRNGLDATTTIAASSKLRIQLHESCLEIEQGTLARAICKIVDITQAILSVVYHIASTHRHLEQSAEAEIIRLQRLASSFSDELPNDLCRAYIEHLNWKLRAYSLALGNKFDIQELQLSPDECVLGCWLNEGGLETISVDVRGGFISAHNRLHQIASQLLTLAEAGKPEKMVDYLLDMESASKEVTLILGEHIEREVRKLVTIDSLTKIGNRRGFVSELKRKIEESARTKIGFGLLFIDVDHFKAVNDLHGHAIGDEVLKAVASRIMQGLRISDIAYRWGGEEFVTLVSTADKKGVTKVAKRILRAISDTPIITSEALLKLTVSIGCVYSPPDSSLTADELVTRADHAMIDAKEQGRNQIFCHYDDSDH